MSKDDEYDVELGFRGLSDTRDVLSVGPEGLYVQKFYGGIA